MTRTTAILLLTLPLLSTPARGAGPSWTSGEDNAAYAAGELCARYVLDGAADTPPPSLGPLVQRDNWKEPGFAGLHPAVRVGFAGFVHVARGERNGARDCEIVARDGDPQALRRAILAALARRAEGFAPMRSRYLPGSAWATEDSLCTRPDSRAPGAFVLLSAAPKGRRPTIILTLTTAASRMVSCDQPGVRLNYRALAPNQG